MSNFYDQLLISDDEVIVNKSQALSLSKKWLTLLVALMCGIFSFVCITQTTWPFRFLSIPVFAAFLMYYAFGYAKIGIKEDVLILKVNKDELEYRGFSTCVIKTENIVNIKDKSYFENENYGGTSRGWHHTIIITYKNIDSSQKTLVIDHCLKHPDHETLLNYIKSVEEGKR